MITFNGCMASLIYKNVWGDDPTCPIFVESTIPPFSTRRVEPGKVRMFERHLAPIAFFPAAAAEKYYDQIRKDVYDFPGLYSDVLECGLSLINPTVHPGLPCQPQQHRKARCQLLFVRARIPTLRSEN